MAKTNSNHLDRYELVDQIAIGGMAEVYRAKAYGAHGFEKSLAIKRILPQLTQNPEFEERFIREAIVAVSLSHANIVQVLDFGRVDGALFIAMELVDGLDMAALLALYHKKNGLLPPSACMQLSISFLRGLDFAHQQGVVHRDVSPSNILISKAGEVKIADFGIARTMARFDDTFEAGQIMGKWRYMSPEQTRGEPLDSASDVFSAAVVIYECFTGKKLFRGETHNEVRASIGHMLLPKICDQRSDIPKDIDDVLALALVRDKANRTISAADLLRRITEISYQSSLVATPLDVAQCVVESMEVQANEEPQQSGPGIDSLIREQLGGVEDSVPWRTDVVLSAEPKRSELKFEQSNLKATFVKNAMGEDGLSQWTVGMEPLTVAAGPAALRLDGKRSENKQTPIRRFLMFALLCGVVGGGAWFAITQIARTDSIVAQKDASVQKVLRAPERQAKLTLASNPAGAEVWIDGTKHPSATPVTVEVQPGLVHRVEMRRVGYTSWVKNDVRPEEGVHLNYSASLLRLSTTFSVRTRPRGARVYLEGQELGTTPLGPISVGIGKGLELRIEKDQMKPVVLKLDLDASHPKTIDMHLEPKVIYGTIRIGIAGSWAEVWLKGKKLGVVPEDVIRLPLGTHRLRLFNPQSKKKHALTVKVIPNRERVYSNIQLK